MERTFPTIATTIDTIDILVLKNRAWAIISAVTLHEETSIVKYGLDG